MAALDSTTRALITAALGRWWSNLHETLGSCTKSDLRAAIDATDDWIDSNATSYNSALPNPFKNNATALQKTIVFCFVAFKRAGLTIPNEVS